MPYVKGGVGKQVGHLEMTLRELQRVEGQVEAVVKDPDGQESPLRDLLRGLGDVGLTRRLSAQKVELTREAEEWLSTKDPLLLLQTFHKSVRFIGELLSIVASETLSQREILELGNRRYELRWSSMDQVRRRTTWLRDLGIVSLTFEHKIGLTEAGRTALETLIIEPPLSDSLTEVSGEIKQDLPQAPPDIQVLIDGLDEQSLKDRKLAIGYIPRGGGGSSIIESLRALANACAPRTTKEAYSQYCESNYGVKRSSAASSLYAVIALGLVTQTGFDEYSPTEAGAAWLESGSDLDLVRIVHTRMRYVLELIPAVQVEDRAPTLANYVSRTFALPPQDAASIRDRLNLLSAAGLIERSGYATYRPTALGLAFAASIPCEGPAVAFSDDNDLLDRVELSIRKRSNALATELVAAGTASDDPTRLEKAVAEMFTELGFETQHLGGAGRTDVLLSARADPNNEVRVIVDAKSSRAGQVGEGQINFDTIGEHRELHQAQFAVVVAPSFVGARLIARAAQHSVVLLTCSDLCSVLRRQESTPLSLTELIVLFDTASDGMSRLVERWNEAERKRSLLANVVEALIEESADADAVTSGALTADQLYLVLRGVVDPRPKPSDIEEVIQLLENPLVASVRVVAAAASRDSKPQRYIVDSRRLVAHKLRALAQLVEGDDA